MTDHTDAEVDKTKASEGAREIQASPESGDQRKNREAGKSNRHIPSRNECMHAISQLPGLIAMKIVAPGQANAIRAAYETLLKEHGKSQANQHGQLSNDDVMEMFRKQPGMLSLVEPLLTDEQIQLVMGKEATDGDGQA